MYYCFKCGWKGNKVKLLSNGHFECPECKKNVISLLADDEL